LEKLQPGAVFMVRVRSGTRAAACVCDDDSAIVRAILQTCVDLGIDVIAEGFETPTEYQWFLEANVGYF
jgi:EAL domain-containing protein (putative c-di-GMP-specific phosphodiesterase class I)